MRTIALVAVLAAVLAGCSVLTEMRLEGEWESDATPKRALSLKGDNTYQQRFSGKTLGFLSEMLGPEAGTWSVESTHLVLVRQDASGEQTTRRLPLSNLSSNSVTLAGESWHRVPEGSTTGRP